MADSIQKLSEEEKDILPKLVSLVGQKDLARDGRVLEAMRDFLSKNEEKSVAKGDKMEAPQPAPTIDESTGLPEEEAKQGDEGVVSPQSFPIGAKVRIHVSRLKRKFDGQLAEVESVGQKFVKVRMLTGPSMTETKQFLPTCIKLEEPVKAAETEKTSAASTAAQRAEAMFGKCDDI